MLFKVFLFLTVLSLANARHGHDHHGRHEQQWAEAEQRQNKKLDQVGQLLQVVRDGQLIEMTYDMWKTEKDMNKKLDALLPTGTKLDVTEDKVIEEDTVMGGGVATEGDVATDEGMAMMRGEAMEIDRVQPPKTAPEKTDEHRNFMSL